MSELLEKKTLGRSSFLAESSKDSVAEKEFSRSLFLKGSGAVVVGLGTAGAAQAINAPNHPNPAHSGHATSGPPNNTIDGWLQVHPNNTVSVYAGWVEYGHGTPTAVVARVADEMDLATNQVKWMPPDSVTTQSANSFGSGGTNAGRSTSGTSMRTAAAAARLAMLRMAAAQWNRPVGDLRVSWGVITVPGTGLRTTYGALMGNKLFGNNTAMGPFSANDLGAGTSAGVGATPKTASQYKIVGNHVPQIHIPKIASGKEIFVQQLMIPGMVHGRVVRPRGMPGWAKASNIVSLDEGSVKHIPNVQVVRHHNFVGVIAPKEYDAIQAAAQLKVTWDDTSPWMFGSGALEKALRTKLSGPAAGAFNASSTSALNNATARTPKLKFLVAYQGHFPMAPNAAVVDVSPRYNASGQMIRDNFMTIYSNHQGGNKNNVGWWAANRVNPSKFPGTSAPSGAARTVWYPASGTYGQSNYDDPVAAAAAMVAMSGKKAIRVVLMRWDEHGWSFTGPPVLAEAQWAVSANGQLAGAQLRGWTHQWNGGSTPVSRFMLGQAYPTNTSNGNVHAQAMGGSYYSFPGSSTQQVNNPVHTAQGFMKSTWFRAPQEPQGNFIGQQMMDAAAVAAKMDTIAFQKRNLTMNANGTRRRTLLDAAAKAAKWKSRVSGSAVDPRKNIVKGRGVALGGFGNTSVVAIAEVTVNKKTGKVRVDRVTEAQEMGLAVNPTGVKSQMVGCIVQGVSRALCEQMRFNRTRVTSLDWITYPILRFKDTPKVTTILLQRKDLEGSSGGSGEAPTVPVPAAVANAIYDATGVRMTHMPMTPAYVRARLRQNGVFGF